MNVQIVTFRLGGIAEADYAAHCAQVAPVFGEIPGLGAKLWIADRERGVYGGVYLFRDAGSARAYRRSALFQGIAETPGLMGVESHTFDVLEEPTRATQPALELFPAPAGATR